MDRDTIKSQLTEGLKHTKKVLKNKKGKINRDLIFTVGDKQFLINRWDAGGHWNEKEKNDPSCFFVKDNDESDRDTTTENYLDAEISSSRCGSKDLGLFLVGDMSKYAYGSKGIGMPCNQKSQGGFCLADIDVLMSDDVSLQKVRWGNDDQKITYLDTLIENLIPVLDDDYLPNCYKNNELFYNEFIKVGTDAIHNGWKDDVLTDIGKTVVTERFIESLGFRKSRWNDDGNENIDFNIETRDFKSKFTDNNFISELISTSIIPKPQDFFTGLTKEEIEGRYSDGLYEKIAWKRVYQDNLKECA